MIFDKIIFVKNNKLARSSLIVFVGSFFGGFGGYLYNMIMGRMLGPADYGILASLTSLFYILSVPSGTLSVVVSRNVAELAARGELVRLRQFIGKLNKWFIAIGAAIFVLFVYLSPFVAGFLNISSIVPVAIVGILFGVSFIGAVNMAALQGMQKFFHFSMNGILSSAAKLVLAIAFVWVGWGVNGALGAQAVAAVIAVARAWSCLNLPKPSAAPPAFLMDIAPMVDFAKPVFLSTLAIATLYNIDVVLVKHFFEPTMAGYYGVLSLLGKIVFFITGSVAIVLFPAVVQRRSRNEKHDHILKYSALLVLAAALSVTGMYFIFPEFVVTLLFGKAYLPIASYLGYFGLMVTVFSLINLLATYNLSLCRTKFIPVLLAGLFLEIALIYFFHDTIQQVVDSMLVSMILILAGMIGVHRSYKAESP